MSEYSVMKGSNSELNAFRMQWQAELSANFPLKIDATASSKVEESRNLPLINTTSTSQDFRNKNDDPNPDENFNGKISNEESRLSHTTLLTALDHYELAVEREIEGNLGDSLDLYRKSFRMDHNVDCAYRLKHFPPQDVKGGHTTSHSFPDIRSKVKIEKDNLPGDNSNFKQMITKFSDCSMAQATFNHEHVPFPCLFFKLPDEIIYQILMSVAFIDVASFSRMAQVCKRLSSMVAREESIWKQICLESEVGFGAMHYEWQRDIYGEKMHRQEYTMTLPENSPNNLSPNLFAEELLNKLYTSSWRQMFRLRPRIRFNGCYISTNNYLRPGEQSASQYTWNSPIHIVTYYRYLRFFRNGTLISLLTTNKPIDVIHYLTKEYLRIHQNRSTSHQATKFMQNALRGRWHLGRYSNKSNLDNLVDESDVFIETEGVNVNYLYQMKLSFRSVGKNCKNNKLVWQYFKYFNRLTNEVGDFDLKNDKGYFWSRVKSYEGSGSTDAL